MQRLLSCQSCCGKRAYTVRRSPNVPRRRGCRGTPAFHVVYAVCRRAASRADTVPCPSLASLPMRSALWRAVCWPGPPPAATHLRRADVVGRRSVRGESDVVSPEPCASSIPRPRRCIPPHPHASAAVLVSCLPQGRGGQGSPAEGRGKAAAGRRRTRQRTPLRMTSSVE